LFKKLKVGKRRDLTEAAGEDLSLLNLGAEKDVYVVSASIMSAYAQQRIVLWALLALIFVMSIVIVILVKAYLHREIWVFVKDHLGQVVQADKNSFLRGNDVRTDNEILGFTLRWIRDAYEYTPLNVRDNLNYAMRFVEPSVQSLVADGLRVSDRAVSVSSGVSVKIEDNIERGDGPTATIVSRPPQGHLEVMVIFDRVAIDSRGKGTNIGQTVVQVRLREIPRVPRNPHGLLVAGFSVTR